MGMFRTGTVKAKTESPPCLYQGMIVPFSVRKSVGLILESEGTPF